MRNEILKRVAGPLTAFALILMLGCSQPSTTENAEGEAAAENGAPASTESGSAASSGSSPAAKGSGSAAKGGSSAASGGGSPSASSGSGSAAGDSGGQAAPAPTPAPIPAPRRAMLDTGTTLRVRTTNTLSTKSAQSGEAFTASLEEPLVDGDWVIAPKGSTVRGTVVESDAGGRVKGVATLAIRLTQLETADGQTIDITSSTFATEAQSTKKKDAVKVGIASGVGAAIGAIAGGGKGAAIGAGVGAGAGTGAVLATQGEAAVIPSETVVNFTLRDPVTITKR